MSSTYILRKAGDPTRERVLANVLQHLTRLPDNRAWAIEIKQHVKTRSELQNAYLWGVVYATLQQKTGQSAEDWHDFWLGSYFGWDEIELFGKKRLKPKRRSSKLSTVEFADYVDFILAGAAEYGVVIPLPNEDLREAA